MLRKSNGLSTIARSLVMNIPPSILIAVLLAALQIIKDAVDKKEN